MNNIHIVYISKRSQEVVYRCRKATATKLTFPKIPKGRTVSKSSFALHDTVAIFRTDGEFLLRYNNLGKLAPVWRAPLWHFLLRLYKEVLGITNNILFP